MSDLTQIDHKYPFDIFSRFDSAACARYLLVRVVAYCISRWPATEDQHGRRGSDHQYSAGWILFICTWA